MPDVACLPRLSPIRPTPSRPPARPLAKEQPACSSLTRLTPFMLDNRKPNLARLHLGQNNLAWLSMSLSCRFGLAGQRAVGQPGTRPGTQACMYEKQIAMNNHVICIMSYKMTYKVCIPKITSYANIVTIYIRTPLILNAFGFPSNNLRQDACQKIP